MRATLRAWVCALLLASACERDAGRAAAGATTAGGGAPTQAARVGRTAATTTTTTAAGARHAAPGGGELAGLAYVERMTGGARPDEAVPIVIAVHGLGDRPEHFAPLLDGLRARARVLAPRGLEAWGDGYSWFAVDDRGDDARGAGVLRAAAAVARMAEAARGELPSRGKPVVTGFSQGGMISFALALHHGASIAAAVPVSGALPGPVVPGERPAQPAPIFALHGEADRRLPLAATTEAVERLRALGVAVEMTTYPGVSHTISPAMRRDLHERLAKAIEAAVMGG